MSDEPFAHLCESLDFPMAVVTVAVVGVWPALVIATRVAAAVAD